MTFYFKVSMMTNTNPHGFAILILLVESLCVSPGLICPKISYLGGPAQLNCTGGELVHTYYNTGGKVATCGLTLNSSCDSTDMSAYRLSANQTALNITSVQISDAGTWVCKNARNSNTSCHLTIANIPTYSITRDRATDAVDVYDGVSLTVDIWGFYCSAAHNLTLQVGSLTLPLNMYLPETVTEPTNLNFTISINGTESHFWDVELIFLCNDQQLNARNRSVTQTSTKVSDTSTTSNTGVKQQTNQPTTNTADTTEELIHILIALSVCDIVIIAFVILRCWCNRHNLSTVNSINQVDDSLHIQSSSSTDMNMNEPGTVTRGATREAPG